MILPEPPSGRFDGSCHLFAVRVYFEDTDFSGVVYHANYLRWFERARSDMLRLLGIDQRAAFDASEGAYAVADLALRYLAPARLGDAVLIRSEVIVVSAATCRVRQRALRGPDLLCVGSFAWHLLRQMAVRAASLQAGFPRLPKLSPPGFLMKAPF